MNIFEKIKQFFENIFKKQKLLESPKEIREEIPNMTNSYEKENKFIEDIKFDPKDLLDPRVCKGKDLVPNILRLLGVNEDIIKNPQSIEKIKLAIREIANQNGIEMPSIEEQPTRETINGIVEAIKSNGILSSKDIKDKYHVLKGDDHKIYTGISIDQGTVTIQEFKMSGKESRVIDGNSVNEIYFEPDGKGNVVEYGTYNRINIDDFSKQARLSGTSEVVYNPDGIEMKSERKSYEQVDDQDVLKYYIKLTRDDQYPFIKQQETIVNDTGHGSPVGTEYIAIEMKNLAKLGLDEYQKDENGNNTTIPITFENKEQISSYYQENKEIIGNAFTQEPKVNGLSISKDLSQSLKVGVKNLAVKSGILPDEHEQETEIDG